MDVEYKPPTAGHYIASLLMPPYGLIAGIVAMSRSMVGPGFGLWATGALGSFVVWPAIITILALAS
jgi:hypothetical protein